MGQIKNIATQGVRVYKEGEQLYPAGCIMQVNCGFSVIANKQNLLVRHEGDACHMNVPGEIMGNPVPGTVETVQIKDNVDGKFLWIGADQVDDLTNGCKNCC
jgi:hypothetical protein